MCLCRQLFSLFVPAIVSYLAVIVDKHSVPNIECHLIRFNSIVSQYFALCACRSVNIRESQQMSLQRNIDLHNLDVFGPGVGPSPKNSPVTNKRKEPRKEPPTPPVKNPPPLPQVGMNSHSRF